jgi:GNAT superfamily N-acetyltransferase
VDIVPVQGPRDLKRFIRVPFDRYKDDPYWVAPLPSDEVVRLTPGKNPYFEHAEAAYFLAREGDRIRGRVSASVDKNYDSFQKERQATFGFFEADAAETAAGLLAAAERWSREKGAEVLRGPMSFTTNDECGLLVDGPARRPMILMPYNPREYAGWIEAAGFRKAKDLFSFDVSVPERTAPVFERMSAIARKKDRIVTRPINMSRFNEELGKVKQVYNSAWDANWGFVPMTDAEIDHMAKQLKAAIVPELVRFAEVDGEPVGFCIVLPDVNVALAKIRGRLFPFGIFRLLWDLPRIRDERFMALGIRADYRKTGIAPLLITEATEASRARGMKSCEIGWTLEDNDMVNRLILSFGAVRSSVYRVYERPLSA